MWQAVVTEMAAKKVADETQNKVEKIPEEVAEFLKSTASAVAALVGFQIDIPERNDNLSQAYQQKKEQKKKNLPSLSIRNARGFSPRP